MSTPSRFPTRLALLVAFATVAPAAFAQTLDSKPQNPTSQFYVADVEGLSSVIIDDKIEDLTKKSVYAAEGVVLETAPDSHNAIVLSNGTGIAFDPDTRLEIRRFLQEPFSPDRTDLDVEPSVSQTTAFLPRGTIGLCTSKLVAGSTMTYNTRHGSISIRGRKVVISTNDTQTVVSLLEGDVTVRGELMAGGQPLKPGQQAIITRTSNFEPPTIVIQPIPEEEMNGLSEKVAIACMARKTVHFDVAERQNQDASDGVFNQTDASGQQVIVPVEVLPGTIPPKITISPYTIPATP